jgi:hypothetical protein
VLQSGADFLQGEAPRKMGGIRDVRIVPVASAKMRKAVA